MRVYLPASHDLLASWLAAGRIDLELGFAVTAGLRRLFADAEEAELEYHALAEAAEAALRAAAALSMATACATEDGRPSARRLVVVADTAHAQEAADLGEGIVRLTQPIPWRGVVSLHLDDDDAMPSVAAAMSALAAAADGQVDQALAVDDPAAEAAVAETAGYELMWFDVSESYEVLAALR